MACPFHQKNYLSFYQVNALHSSSESIIKTPGINISNERLLIFIVTMDSYIFLFGSRFTAVQKSDKKYRHTSMCTWKSQGMHHNILLGPLSCKAPFTHSIHIAQEFDISSIQFKCIPSLIRSPIYSFCLCNNARFPYVS